MAQAIEELGIEGKTVGVAPVGCAVMAYNYFTCDMVEAPHGRAPAVATGIKASTVRTISSLRIRAMATWLLSALPRRSIPLPAGRISPLFLSTTRFTV